MKYYGINMVPNTKNSTEAKYLPAAKIYLLLLCIAQEIQLKFCDNQL